MEICWSVRGRENFANVGDEQNGELEIMARVVHIGCTPFSTGSCLEPVLKVQRRPHLCSNSGGKAFSTGSAHEPVLKTLTEPALMPWALEPVPMLPLIPVRN